MPPYGLYMRAWLLWVGTRLVTLLLLFSIEQDSLGDAEFYQLVFSGAEDQPVAYPLYGLATMGLPWLVSGLWGHAHFDMVIVAQWLVVDALFFAWLRGRESDAARAVRAETLWLATLPMLGGVVYARFDLLPSVLVAGAVYAVSRTPGLAAAMLAVAVAVKLWPILLFPVLVAASRERLRFTSVFAGVGIALAALAGVVGGWSELFDPLRVQGDRGLEIEAVAATPLMVARFLSPQTYDTGLVWYSLEISGPGVGAATAVATLATAALLLATALSAWRAARLGRAGDPHVLAWLSLAAVSGLVATGKVLSPQYLLWIVPLAAIALLIANSHGLTRWTRLLLWTAAATHLVFPIGFAHLWSHPGDLPPVLFLAARNLMVVVLAVLAWREIWVLLRKPAVATADETAAVRLS